MTSSAISVLMTSGCIPWKSMGAAEATVEDLVRVWLKPEGVPHSCFRFWSDLTCKYHSTLSMPSSLQ